MTQIPSFFTFFCKAQVAESGILSANLPEISGFVLPGRNVTEAQVHIARAVARRAERYFVAVSEKEPALPKEAAFPSEALNSNAGDYLNRLSGYLFVLAQS